jgi:heme exporter protein A
MQSLIIDNIACIRQNYMLFKNFSFTLNSGEGLIIQGANGSGKTSLLRILSGFMSPASGNIFWQKINIRDQLLSYRHLLHYLGHTNGVKKHLTVIENINLLNIFNLQSSTEDIKHVLLTLQLESYQRTPVARLSSGQQRRLSFARLLMIKRKLWFLDEPLTGLDHHSQQVFCTILQKHLNQSGIAIMSSHHSMPSLESTHLHQTRLLSC